MRTDAGIQGQYDWKRGYASFDLGYIGVAAKDTAKTRALNGFDLNFNVVSKPSGDAYFHYDIDLDYSMAADDMRFKKRDVSMIEHNFDFDAEVGAVFAKSHHLLFDLGLQTLAYAREFGVSATEISFFVQNEEKHLIVSVCMTDKKKNVRKQLPERQTRSYPH